MATAVNPVRIPLLSTFMSQTETSDIEPISLAQLSDIESIPYPTSQGIKTKH